MKRCNHPFTQESSGASEYLCGCCKTLGFGTRHRCNDCELELHDFCKRCPETIHAPHLHRHLLTLAKASKSTDRICNICGEEAEGLFFECVVCNFDVHPLCTQLPPAVRHRAHANASAGHELCLRRWNMRASCFMCRLPCEFWWYRCERCAADIHPECLVKPLADTAAAEIATRSLRPAHPALKPAWSFPPARPPWPSQPSFFCDYYHFVLYFYGINMPQQPWPLPQQQAVHTIHSSYGGINQHHHPHHHHPHPRPHLEVHHHHHHYHHHHLPQTPSHWAPARPPSYHPLHQAYSSNAHHHLQAEPTGSSFEHHHCCAHVASATNGASSSDATADDGQEEKKRKRRRIYALVGRILQAVLTTGLVILVG